jgi:drug/metabolite transporter (DMT)-like permease
VWAQLGFALFPIFGKLALSSIPPLVLAALRVVSAAILLEAIRRLFTREEIARADRRRVLLYALLGVSFNQILFILGLSLTTAIHTTILTAMIPVFTLAAAVFLGRERMALSTGAALMLALAGALLLLNVRDLGPRSDSLRGDFLLLANGMSYSLYLVFSRPVLERYRVATYTAAVFRYGALPIVLVATPSLANFSPSAVSPLSWACLAGVILFCTVLPYLLNSWALARTDASQVAFYVLVQPVFSAALAVAILGEELTEKTVLAAVLILAGLAVSSIRSRRLPVRPLP